jgi:hypothetical protein
MGLVMWESAASISGISPSAWIRSKELMSPRIDDESCVKTMIDSIVAVYRIAVSSRCVMADD